MNETVEAIDLIPEEERIENIPPFQVGDLVMMRASALRLDRFCRYPKNDVGIVLELKKNNMGEWLVNIHWQKFVPKNGKCIVKHSRLKKARARKNVQQKD
jgi:hypothetical protein